MMIGDVREAAHQRQRIFTAFLGSLGAVFFRSRIIDTEKLRDNWIHGWKVMG
jgi:hypothetical protein